MKATISRSFYWPNGGSLTVQRMQLAAIAWHVSFPGDISFYRARSLAHACKLASEFLSKCAQVAASELREYGSPNPHTLPNELREANG